MAAPHKGAKCARMIEHVIGPRPAFEPADIATLRRSYDSVVAEVSRRHAVDDRRALRIAELVLRCAARRPLLDERGRIDQRAITLESVMEVLNDFGREGGPSPSHA